MINSGRCPCVTLLAGNSSKEEKTVTHGALALMYIFIWTGSPIHVLPLPNASHSLIANI